MPRVNPNQDTKTLLTSMAYTLAMRRVFLQLSQADIAAAIGVADETISTWENGRKQPTATNLIAWIDILGMQLHFTPKTEETP